MENKNKPLLCNPEKGACELPSSTTKTHNKKAISSKKPLKIIYFTDPICSSCWGVEPQIRKLKLEYQNLIEIEYHMGGLLPDWNYNSGGISKPLDVASHWDEASQYYQMPIDGSVWLEDPLHSSYPPSIAFKAAQLQDQAKALVFLREIREMVFLKKKNITKWKHLAAAAQFAELDTILLKRDYEQQAEVLFKEDLELSEKLGVRGFPTFFIYNKQGDSELIYGARAYSFFEEAIVKMSPELKKSNYPKNWDSLFKKYPTLTTKEFSELSGNSFTESRQLLEKLFVKNKLAKFSTKNGTLWIRQSSNQ